jgi:hypothetical protein
MQGDFLDRAAPWQGWTVSEGDARRRACPRMPASPGNVYPSRTRARRRRQDRQHNTPIYRAFAEPSDGLEPSTPSLPWRCSTN